MLILEQRFPLGRFHATRWNQNPFEDSFGEWPPSPWRLLRALAARWFQYSRETVDADLSAINSLLNALSQSPPSFYLPTESARGPIIKQYHPTEVAWTNASKNVPAYKKPKTTLVEDHCRSLPNGASILWFWPHCDLDGLSISLLDRLLERVLYFGRTESFCWIRRLIDLEPSPEPNCILGKSDSGRDNPVLVSLPGEPLRVDSLLAATDDRALTGRSIPPGTVWYFASLSGRGVIGRSPLSAPVARRDVAFLQCAIGGGVLPPLSRWIKLTERFRGRMVKSCLALLAGHANPSFDELSAEQKTCISLLVGKDSEGRPTQGHRHAYFLVWPNSMGVPVRLVVWRPEPFTTDELDAFLQTTESSIAWEPGAAGWKAQFVPLPFDEPAPDGFFGPSRRWVSATPFVPPASRHRFRADGRARASESVECTVERLLAAQLDVAPVSVSVIDHEDQWLSLHESRERRQALAGVRTPLVRPGFALKVEFDRPIAGPLILGDSAHFGLGLFRAIST